MAWTALTCVVSLGVHSPVAELYCQLFTSLSGPAVDNAAARQQLNGKTETTGGKSALGKTKLSARPTLACFKGSSPLSHQPQSLLGQATQQGSATF